MSTTDTSAKSTNGVDPYDYVIVGGGNAGLVVASSLSEDPEVSVLVIEAGGDHSTDPLVLTPGLVGALYGRDEYDWNFESIPQPTLNDRIINQARGRMLGGSSAMNFMMTVYPSKPILDAWGALGNEGWSFDELEPYFRKFATTHGPPESTREISRMDGHYDNNISKGEAGPLQVSFGEGHGPTNSAWFDTFEKLGLRMTTDHRKGTAIGAFQNAATIDPVTKTRSFAVNAYLTEDVRKRNNLAVMTDTVVKRIIFEKEEGEDAVATGVVIRSQDGQEKTIPARLEVIMAAGALQTPQILELSGIGSRWYVAEQGLPVVVDNPYVGEHMQDHPIVCQSFEVAPGVASGDLLRDPDILNAIMEQYQATRDGPLGQSIISSAFTPLLGPSGPLSESARKELLDTYFQAINSDLTPGELLERYSQLPNPSLPSRGRELEEGVLRDLLEKGDEPAIQFLLFPTQIAIPKHPASMATYLTPVEPENYITIMTILNHPFSRGSCHFTSSNIDDKPVWDPAYNKNPIDMEILARAIQFVETFVNTEPFKGILKEGGKRIPKTRGDTLESAKEIVRDRQISVFHVSGSCAMLPVEHGGVVSSKLRVYGTKNLRVVDASIFPLEPSGNIQTTVYAVAERAADLIKEARRNAASTPVKD